MYWNQIPCDFEFIFVDQVWPWREEPDLSVEGEHNTAVAQDRDTGNASTKVKTTVLIDLSTKMLMTNLCFEVAGSPGMSRLKCGPSALAAAPQTTPWGTHAYIISLSAAERLSNLGSWMIQRAALENDDKSAWELDGDDIKIDHFIRNYYDHLLPAKDRNRYAETQPLTRLLQLPAVQAGSQ